MISGTFCSRWVVFKSALKRLKWLGILYGVALFLELPMILWMELAKRKSLEGNLLADALNKSDIPRMLFNPLEHFVNAAVAITLGLILFHYLQKDRASSFFHALPIKRWSLYWQNLLAGLTLMWVPILINWLLIYVVFNAFGITEGQWHTQNIYDSTMGMFKAVQPDIIPIWQVLIYWLLLSLLMTGLYYIFTVFVAMLTGNVLLQGALTIIGLVLPSGLYVLIKYNLWKLLYGFPRDFDGKTAEWLSPLISYINGQSNRYLFNTWTWYMWYLVAAVILCVASIYLYKKRHAEAAGETLANEWIRWIFKYGVAVCSAFTGGLYFSTFNENSAGVLYLGYFIGGVLGYIIADMIANKSFHFYKRWKGMVAFSVVFVLLLVSVNLDIYGYEKYVPEQEDVKEVFLSNLNREGYAVDEGLTGQESIVRVRQFHRQIIEMEQENKAQARAANNRQTTSIAGPEDIANKTVPVEITYVLDSGAKVRRSYIINVDRYRQFLYPIFNTQEAKRSMFARLFKIEESKIDQINVSNFHLAKNIRIYKRAEIAEALDALRKDVLNVSYEAAVEYKVPTQATVEFLSKAEEGNMGSYSLSYFPGFKNFEAFLSEHGYQKELFLEPAEVSEIIVKKVGTNETVEVKDKQKIKTLLNWCNLEDERSFIMRQQPPQPRYKDMIKYYGKIVLRNGSLMYVSFENSPYARPEVEELVKSK